MDSAALASAGKATASSVPRNPSIALRDAVAEATSASSSSSLARVVECFDICGDLWQVPRGQFDVGGRLRRRLRTAASISVINPTSFASVTRLSKSPITLRRSPGMAWISSELIKARDSSKSATKAAGALRVCIRH